MHISTAHFDLPNQSSVVKRTSNPSNILVIQRQARNASEAFEHDAASEPLSDDEGSESEAPDEPDEPARAEETHEAE